MLSHANYIMLPPKCSKAFDWALAARYKEYK